MSAVEWIGAGTGLGGLVIGGLAWIRAGRAVKAAEASALAADRSADAAEASVDLQRETLRAEETRYLAGRAADVQLERVKGSAADRRLTLIISNPEGAPASEVVVEGLEVRGQPITGFKSGVLESLPAGARRDMGVEVPQEVITTEQLSEVKVTFAYTDGRGRQTGVERLWRAPQH